LSKFKIIDKSDLAPEIKSLKITAPIIARKAQAGQFVILRIDEKGERFPLTIVDWNQVEETITLIFQEIGVSTKKLGKLKIGEQIADIAGPLGNPSQIEEYGTAVVIGGGLGTALIYPWVRALKKAGNYIISILGARNMNLLLLEKELRKLSDEVYISTDDGSKGVKGFTSDVLKRLLIQGRKLDIVMAGGPVPMMRAVSEVTRPYKIKTVVSLNPIMIDGTGMCGGCRITIGGETKYACVDGPEFNAHTVDFIEKRNIFWLFIFDYCVKNLKTWKKM
jgi:ferredoxin--NADP+ reductase